MKSAILTISALWLLTGCGIRQENKYLRAQLDSMQTVLEAQAYTVGLLEQIGQYLDSIDANRKSITLSLEAGITEDDYIERMKNLNAYVQKAEWTIGELEKTRTTYTAQLNRLKNEMVRKDLEIQTLQFNIAEYQNENSELKELLTLTEDDLLNSRLDLDSQSRAMELANSKIQAWMEKVQLTKAESYYAQGEGKEETARHIQFAPRKKRQALDDALDLYSVSYDLGYGPAKAKVDALKEKPGIN